jgi:hypothetical protein
VIQDRLQLLLLLMARLAGASHQCFWLNWAIRSMYSQRLLQCCLTMHGVYTQIAGSHWRKPCTPRGTADEPCLLDAAARKALRACTSLLQQSGW